jgi:hypothetical protein
MSLSLFKMFQPRINHFFDTTKFGAPGIFCVIEPLVDSVESSIHMRLQIANARIQIAQPRVVDKDSHQYSDRGNTNRKGDLNGLIGHRCHQNTLSSSLLS